MAEYVGKMRSLADEITSTGKTIDDDELVSYILVGLDYDYNPIVTSLTARIKPLSVGEAYSQLLAFEQRMDLLQPNERSSINSASRGAAHREDAVVEGARAAGLLVAGVGAPAGHLVNNMAPLMAPTTTHVGRTTGQGVRFAKRRATRLTFVGTDLMKSLYQMKNMQVQLHPME